MRDEWLIVGLDSGGESVFQRTDMFVLNSFFEFLSNQKKLFELGGDSQK